MASPIVSTPSGTPAPRRWLRRLGWAGGALIALLVVVYFVCTSSAFLKGVILPKVSESLHARVTISDASISPFSQVRLRDLKVETVGTEPLVTAQEVRAQYKLWDILHGRIHVSEVALIKPTVTLVRNTNGTSNLDPITQADATAGKAKATPPPTRADKPASTAQVSIDFGKIALQDATVRMIEQRPGGGRDRTEVSKVNITLESLKNGQTGKLTLGAEIALDKQAPPPGTNANLQAKLDGSFDVALGADLSLTSLKGGMRLSVPQAGGALAEVAGFSLALETEVGADPAKQSAVLRTLKLNAARRDTPLVLASLSSPFTLSWGGNSGGVGDAALSVTLTNLNLAEWKGLAPDLDPAGNVHATLALTSQQAGKQIGLNLAAYVDGLGLKTGSNAIAGLDLVLAVTGQAVDFKQVDLRGCRFSLARRSARLLLVDTQGKVDLAKTTADLTARAEANLPGLMQLAPAGGATLTSGTATFDTQVSQGAGATLVTGTLGLSSLTGSMGEQAFTNLALSSAYDLSWKDTKQLDLRRCLLTLAPTPRAPTNAVDLHGTMDVSKADAISGALQLVGDTLDVTPYYDLFAGSPAKPAPAPASKPAPGSEPASKHPAPSTQPQQEPPPIHLPVSLLTFDANIRQCLLRELVLSNVTATARVTADQVTLKPVALVLNGAPVGADVDLKLGVPGYEYAVNFNADRVPLEPLANSFSPDYRGQAKGDMLAAITIKGAGITGPSLQKNLGGNLNLTFTNADIHIVGKRAKALLTPIALVLGFNDLLKAPLNWLGADAKIGEGKINLQQFSVVSSAFSAGSTGEIPLAANPADSPIHDWPVTFSLRRGLAEKLNLAPKDAPTNTDYVALPNFVKVGGTVGDPKTKTDKLALLQVGAAAISALPGNLGKDATKLVGKTDAFLGGKLSGHTNTNSAAGNTNANNATNTASKLLNLFNKPKSK
jgi:uncharacterized protein involved in outer membrane biogenesis